MKNIFKILTLISFFLINSCISNDNDIVDESIVKWSKKSGINKNMIKNIYNIEILEKEENICVYFLDKNELSVGGVPEYCHNKSTPLLVTEMSDVE